VTLVSLAFGAGILATVNPCGFAVLPAFFALYFGDHTIQTPVNAGRLGEGLAVGGAVSLGFAGVFITAGLVVSAGLRSLAGVVPWVAVGVGVTLAVAGIAILAGRHVGVSICAPLRPGAARTGRSMVIFGAGYAAASLSCTLGVLLAVVAQATATHNPLQMLAVLAAYGAGSATVLTALAVGAATARVGLQRGLRQLLPVAGRLGGAVLVASGVYLVVYWWPALGHTTGRGRAPVSLPDAASAWLSRLLDGHTGSFAALSATLAAAAAVTALRARTSRAAKGRSGASSQKDDHG
jgi:cytochrome c-type biogenesis protein